MESDQPGTEWGDAFATASRTSGTGSQRSGRGQRWSAFGRRVMTAEQLTDELARRIMGWQPTRDRYIKARRSWIPRWRFRPMSRRADAFLLLDRAADRYVLTWEGSSYTADVQIGSRRGTAKGKYQARVITLSIARALGLEGTRR